MFDKNQQKVLAGCCFAAFAFFALICLVKHFSFAGLLIFIGTAAMTAGIFTASLRILLPCGFALTSFAYVVEFIGYLIQSFSRGFKGFFLLFPVLECLLMIAVFAGLLKISMNTEGAGKWGIGVTAASFAAMLLVVGTAFAGYFISAGEVNYFVFLERLVLIPIGIFFGVFMEGEEPLLAIDLKKDEKEEEGEGQIIGYTPEENQYRHRRPETEAESGTEKPEEGTEKEPEEEK